MNIKKKTNKCIKKLKSIMNKGIVLSDYELAMSAISAGCDILYKYNQYYVDDDFENGVVKIASEYKNQYGKEISIFEADSNTVLYYDSFGFDVRGVTQIYLNAIVKNNYKLVYVTNNTIGKSMPETTELLNGYDVVWEYISMNSGYKKWANELIELIMIHKPKAMFFYSRPNDVSGCVAFSLFEGIADRFMIDLTDHAFWLGARCFDFYTGSRDISASNLIYGRNVDASKLIKLGGSILVNQLEENHTNLPFDVKTKKYIFSGGQLYKTLGDPNNYYYKIIDHVLESHSDLYFLYAGDGDATEIRKIINRYPDRAYFIGERTDFFYLIQHCVVYLNTYPMFGGMMMKYSAYAKKIPITLRHEDDSEGLLIDQESRRIEYDSYDELIEDLDKLLDDDEYLKDREQLLEGSVITEEQFIKDIRDTIEKHCTCRTHNLNRIDTSMFQREFYDRFNFDEALSECTCRNNYKLFLFFPRMVVIAAKKAFRK